MNSIVLIIVTALLAAVAVYNVSNMAYSIWYRDSSDRQTGRQTHSRKKRQDPNIGSESDKPYETISSSLPKKENGEMNLRYMPTIANGHVGTTIYSKEMFLNGLFNGKGSDSHRAAVPPLIMTRIRLKTNQRREYRRYKFNVREGVFTEVIDCDFATIYHRTYVHAKFIRLLVTDIYAERKGNVPGGGVMFLEYPSLNDTQDIKFQRAYNYYSHLKTTGKTRAAEDGEEPQSVTVYWHTPQREISLTGSTWDFNLTMVMSVDKLDSAAKGDFDDALQILDQRGKKGNYELLQDHINTMQKMWDDGLIEIVGSLEVARVVYFAQYYLLTSLPPLYAKQPTPLNELYYGISRTGLAKGGKGKDYQGHIFWDSEMYILPAVVMFHPDLAKKILWYRMSKGDQAAAHAQKYEKTSQETVIVDGVKQKYEGPGYRYPWESLASGNDVTPDTCVNCRDQAVYVSAAVQHALRIYYSVTKDQEIMTDNRYKACDMSKEIATYLVSLTEYNSDTGRYDIKGVMGPDDFHPNVNNNAFINAATSQAIHWARYFSCECGRSEEIPDDWIQIALYLSLPFDTIKRIHNQHDGYEQDINSTIKQADTILLGYPLNHNMSTDIYRNDLSFYETRTTHDTPAMTWSFFTIGWKWVNEDTKISTYFYKSYQDYTISPFEIWTEYHEKSEDDQKKGSVNFLPGMGAFLQSIIYGFVGIRIRPEMLEFHNPIPPPGATVVKLNSLNYLGATLDVEVQQNRVAITLRSSGQYELKLKRNNTKYGEEQPAEELLERGQTVYIEEPKNGFFIMSSMGSSCEHPRDYIFMPWGYSPWINTSSHTEDQNNSNNSNNNNSSNSSSWREPPEVKVYWGLIFFHLAVAKWSYVI